MSAEFKLSIANSDGKAYKFELKGPDAEKLVGKRIGEKFNGVLIGATGYELEITGGSDKSGFPMRSEIAGGVRKTPVLSGGVGFKPKRKGERRRKTVSGNTLSDSTSQINCKVVKKGKEDLDKIFGAPKEEPKEEKKEEPTAETAETPAEAEVKEEIPKEEEKAEEEK